MADKALIVGINRYPGCPLSGCVNDATHMAQLLTSRYSFNPEGIRMLTDERATTANIMDRLEWLVKDTKAGDRVLFHYSGHGAQVACRNDKTEIDGLNEVICPVDFDWSPRHMITDKEFHSLFIKMAPGVKFNWISDSCHSGDLTRMMPGAPSFLSFWKKTPPKQTPRMFPLLECERWKINIAKSKQILCKALANGQLEVGYISGCRSDQTSADTVIDNTPQGALTGYLLKAMMSTSPESSLSQVVLTVRDQLKRAGYSQIPQVEGSRINVPFLG